MVDVSSQNNSVSINVSSSGNSASIKATPDTALYYSEKSREWAISNRIVDGVDYSSKYYANKSNQSALNAQSFAQSAQDSYNNFQQSVDGALSNIESSVQGAIDEINNTKTDIITDIEFVAKGEKQEIQELSEEIQNKIVDLGIDTRANVDLSNLSVNGEKHFLNKSQITNCLLEVPQNIKLELADGVLTLKAGSKVIVPNGAGVFDEVVIENDLTTTIANANQFFVFYSSGGNIGGFRTPDKAYSGATAPTDTSNHIWYDTDSNKVKLYSGGAYVSTPYSFPLCLVTSNGTNIISIDQVFNGFGYIGSTVWVDKGVKGLAPNGRNADGTLNNSEFITEQLLLRTITYNGNISVFLNPQHTGLFVPATEQVYYDEQKNIITNTGTGEIYHSCILVSAKRENNVITSFQPKLPFRAVDYNDFANTPHIIETYQNGTSWYRVYSDGWCEQGGIYTVPSSATVATISLLKSYSDTNYFVMRSNISTNTADTTNRAVAVSAKTLSSFEMYTSTSSVIPKIMWYACGYIA